METNKTLIFHCLGMHTMGDVMSFMNIAHIKAHSKNTSAKLVFHWYTPPDFQYAHDDVESILERIEYIHQFYREAYALELIHEYHSEDDGFLQENRFVTDEQFITRHIRKNLYYNSREGSRVWPLINPHKKTQNKIVIWRPTFNAELSRVWKRVLNHQDWDNTIDTFKEMGYNVVELCYRTPIREAFYHICTSAACVYYDGMWHYISAGIFKPSMVTALSSIGFQNSINAIPIKSPREMKIALNHWDKPRKRWTHLKTVDKNDKGEDIKIPNPNYTFYDMTTWEYMNAYNKRIHGRVERAYFGEKDWSNSPIIHRKFRGKL